MSWRQRFLRTCISIAGPAFQLVHKTREAAYKIGLFSCYEARVPVISIGNIVTGGSGKTPLAIWLAGRLFSQGLKPAVVSRGYGGTNKQKYLIVSDGTGGRPIHDASVVGDEPYLIACRLPATPVLIGPKRVHPIRAVQQFFAIDVIILDDGFQHLAVARDLDVVLLTGAEDCTLPFIGLREPLSALERADLIFCDGEYSALPHQLATNVPIFRYQRRASGLLNSPFPFQVVDLTRLTNKNVILVSAIARPNRFLDTAKALRWNIVTHVACRDHHFFSTRELQKLLDDHASSELVFTEKDWVKLPDWFQSHERTWALRIDIHVDNEETFLKLVTKNIP